MSLIKCPKCGEMFSDSYKTCPFCEEDEAYYSGKVRKGRGRRTAESSRRRAPSILGPVAVVVLILLVVLVVWLIFGDRIKEAIEGTEKPPVTDVNTPDDSPVTTPDDTAVTPTISLNRTVLVLSVGDKESLKVNGTEETVAWSSSDPTVASVTSSGDVTALAKGTAREDLKPVEEATAARRGADVFNRALKRLPIHAGRRNLRNEAAHRHKTERDENFLAQFGNPERVGKALEHRHLLFYSVETIGLTLN